MPFNKINVKAKQCRTAISCTKFRRNSFLVFIDSKWGIDKFTYFAAWIFLLTRNWPVRPAYLHVDACIYWSYVSTYICFSSGVPLLLPYQAEAEFLLRLPFATCLHKGFGKLSTFLHTIADFSPISTHRHPPNFTKNPLICKQKGLTVVYFRRSQYNWESCCADHDTR